jgi:ketosteroid isomerase-like protein
MTFKRFAAAFLVLALAGPLTARPARAVGENAVMATIQGFVAAFNAGDSKAVLATCATPAVIIDDFPPHVWQGPTACADWVSAYANDAKKNGITDGLVKLGKPWHVVVTGDRAYAVIPATYTYKLRGKPVTESGSIITLSLEKLASWQITGWAWAQH